MKQLCVVLFALAFVFAGTPARAGVVTFDDGLGTCPVYTAEASCSDGGLTFTNNGSYLYVWDGTTPNSNGTDNLIFSGFTPSDYMAITLTAGGTFTLDSFDMAISWYDTNPSETITVNGSPLTITQTLTTYDLGLAGVSEVDVSGVPSLIGYWTMDNVTYNSIPEPCTLALLPVGVALLVLRKRRTGLRRAS